MNCIYCCYFWKEDNEDHFQCHWESRCPDDIPPCEEEDELDEEEYYE